MDDTEADFRAALLPDTLRNAAKYEPYRSLWDIQAGEDVGARPLSVLPTVEKDDLRPDDALAGCADLATISHTSGTTGIVHYTYQTHAERRAHAEFLTASRAELREDERFEEGRKPIIMTFVDVVHGLRGGEEEGPVVPGAVQSHRERLRTVQMLQKRFSAPGVDERVSIIGGPLPNIMLITLELDRLGIRASDLGVRSVNCYAEYVAPEARAFLEDWWGVPLTDRFSCSEAIGIASQCADCGDRYHYFEPVVYPEFVDWNDLSPVESGFATLLLTELYPFKELAPLVRYRTRDIVTVYPPACAAGLPSFAPRGRDQACLWDVDSRGRRRLLIAHADFYDATAAVPEISRGSQHGVEPGFPVHTAILKPRIDARLEESGAGQPKRIAVRAQITFSASYFRDAVARLKRELYEKLLAASPTLREALESGSYELSIEVTNDEVSPLK